MKIDNVMKNLKKYQNFFIQILKENVSNNKNYKNLLWNYVNFQGLL